MWLFPKKYLPLYQKDTKKAADPLLKLIFKKAAALILKEKAADPLLKLFFKKVATPILKGYFPSKKRLHLYQRDLIFFKKAVAPISNGF
jgi:hypothetical protein